MRVGEAIRDDLDRLLTWAEQLGPFGWLLKWPIASKAKRLDFVTDQVESWHQHVEASIEKAARDAAHGLEVMTAIQEGGVVKVFCHPPIGGGGGGYGGAIP
jgi:hypothetical protein